MNARAMAGSKIHEDMHLYVGTMKLLEKLRPGWSEARREREARSLAIYHRMRHEGTTRAQARAWADDAARAADDGGHDDADAIR